MKIDQDNKPFTPVKSVNVNEDKTSVTIQWSDAIRPANFHAVWLRWQCWCPECRDPLFKQPLYSKLGYDYSIRDIALEGNDLVVTFGGCESHVGRVPLSWLRRSTYGDDDLKKYTEITRPMPLKPPVPVEYEDFYHSEEILFQLMLDLGQNGIGLIRNAPLKENLLSSTGKRIAGHLFNEYYGNLAEIRVKDSDKPLLDLGHKNIELPLHMDFPYHESSPLLLLMHCLAFDDCVEGGESNFLNIFYEAERFRVSHHEDFDILTKVPTTFQRKLTTNDGKRYTMTYHRPHFTVNYAGDLIGVGWSTEAHGPTLAHSHFIPAYYKACSNFAEQIENSPYKLTFKLKPGDIVLINNRTLVHGRNVFRLNGGERFLQTVCLGGSDYRKRLGELAVQLDKKIPPLRLGDSDHNFIIPA